MFETLLASRLPPQAWSRPAMLAVVIHGVVIAAAAAAKDNDGDRPPERDTIRLELVLPQRSLTQQSEPAPAPAVPAAPSIPPLKLEPLHPVPSLDPPLSGVPAVAQILADRGAGSESSSGGSPRMDSAFLAADVDRLPQLADEVRPEYPPALRGSGLSGLVEFEYVISSRGWIDSATMLVRTSTHPAFSRAAIEALLSARFRPALRHGRPVPVRVRQTVRFLTR